MKSPLLLLRRDRKFWAVTMLAAGVLSAATYIAGDHWWYRDRVARHVEVSGLELGSLKRDKAAAAIGTLAPREEVVVSTGGEALRITRSDIGAAIDVEATVDKAMTAGRGSWGARRVSVPAVVVIDEGKLDARVKGVVEGRRRQPVDAGLSFEGGQAKVIPDKEGSEVDATALRNDIARAFVEFSSTPVLLREKPLAARIQSEDLAEAANEAQARMATPVSISFNGRIFSPGPEEIGRWLKLETPGTGSPHVVLIGNKLALYVSSIAKQVDIMPVDRQIRVANGQSQLQAEGSDGERMDQNTLAAALRKAIENRQGLDYAIALKPAPRKTVTSTLVGNTTGRLIEVSLSRQRLWAWQDGKVVHEAPITSGASALGWPTITGKFAIQAKQRNRYLNGQSLGYNYNVFVKYWMPFSGNYGFHDASWRGGKFGTQDYVRTGSHGCVNMPEEAAVFLYNWAPVGTAVVVHKS